VPLVLQRTFTRLIQEREPALPMGDISGVIPLLPVRHQGQHAPHIARRPGQDAAQQHLHLGEGQRWRAFFNWRHVRTRKKCARIQSVI
jgi:hypothetical protein